MSSLSQYQNVFRVAKQNVTDFKGSEHRTIKRNRQILSCSACREKKLKCDREIPCAACVKRGDAASCGQPLAGLSSIPGRSTVSKDSEAQLRLQKLERMVTNLMEAPKAIATSHSTNSLLERMTVDKALEDLSVRRPTRAVKTLLPGHLELNGCQMDYLGGTHWTTILENIRDIQDILQPETDENIGLRSDASPRDTGCFIDKAGSLTSAEAYNCLPSRSVVNNLLAVYFNTKYSRSPIIHSQRFVREYEVFWANPSTVSLLWISMLFSALHVASRISQASGNERLDSSMLPPQTTYLTRACQALVAGGYDEAKPYSVEALLLYGIGKFTDNKDRDTNAWMIIGVAARLAMRMGYHRDPCHLPSITPFEGEMRRRVFLTIETFDLLLSFQAGLPAVIHEEEFDTELPSNLLDEDFEENCKVLPPSRPPTDSTPMLYYRYKGRFAKVFRRVIRHVLTLKETSYQDTLKLDSELREIHNEVPPSLQMKSIGSSITDEAYMILWRLNIDLLYLRSLCVLHRQYISRNLLDPSYDYSRNTCVNSALRLLEHQHEVEFACRLGGRLCNDQWMLSSSILNDFLLAAMIICLDLYELYKSSNASLRADVETASRKRNALKISHEIWTSRKDCSREARRASRILNLMLSRIPRPDSLCSPLHAVEQVKTHLPVDGVDAAHTTMKPCDNSAETGSFEHLNNLDQSDSLSNEPLEAIFNDPDNIDWGFIDQYFHDKNDLDDSIPIDWQVFDQIGTTPTQ